MLTWLLAGLVLAAEPEGGRPPPVAVVVEVTARPQRSDGTRSRPLRRLDLLRPGERVSAGEGGSVTVLFVADGHLEKLAPGAGITVTETRGRPTGPVKRLPAAVSGANLDALRDMVRSGKIGGGTFRGDEPPRPAVAPVDGAVVAGDRPVLRWPAAEGATAYRVTLFAGAGPHAKELRNEETKAPEWRPPAEAPPLRRNRAYRWRAVALRPDGSEEPVIKESWFTVASAETERQATALAELARREDPAEVLVAVLGFESHRLLDPLYPLYAKLAEKAGDDPNLWAKVAEYAARAGLRQEAAAALKKARDHGWKPGTP